MASFINRKGERVEVSEEFIDTAIKLKIELQKQSPSGKCSYATLKKMMHKEGFEEADSNESMRQMIKREQKKRGELPSVDTYADMVSDSKLESIREAVGEMSLRKREAQLTFNQLNKMKREWSRDILLLESIESALKDKEFPIVEHNPVTDNTKPKKKMIAVLSDIHYGALVDVEGYTYDTDIAKELLLSYVEKIKSIAKENNVEEIYLMNVGDLVEHLYMRNQNFYSAEKLLSEQVAEVTDIIISMLADLSSQFEVSYSAINGNHDRMAGKKDDNIYGDGVVSISNKIVQTYIKYSGNEHIRYIDAEPYHHIISTHGRNFLFVHGDKNSLKKETVLAEQSMLHGVRLDAIIGGHIHNHRVTEVGEDKYIVTFGSIKGSDEYSLKTIGATASRSQGVILVDEEGEFEIKQVKLKL